MFTLMQRGLAPLSGEQLAPSQQAWAVPRDATWPGPYQLRGAIPHLERVFVSDHFGGGSFRGVVGLTSLVNVL
jgi:hypothetical protein